jgi:hypothetical protein
LLNRFSAVLRAHLVERAKDPDVAGFKSVVCYRTGLDVSIVSESAAEIEALRSVSGRFSLDVPLRLEDKPLNDLVVRTVVEVAAEHNKPGMIPFGFIVTQCYALFSHVHHPP